MTFSRLSSNLNNVIYSMETAQIDFYAYQYKPVLKFIDSPTERLILADEVGLGKTIEAGIIWMEMVARDKSKTLLIVCPTKQLGKKWEIELQTKFQIDARQVDFNGLDREYDNFVQSGGSKPFALIVTYRSLHRSEKNPKKQDFYNKIEAWDDQQSNVFDLVIFDEAHHLRNQTTETYRVSSFLSAAAKSILCVSATPVNNKNGDLLSLLRFIDEDYFSSQPEFDELIINNQPIVRFSNILQQPNPNSDDINELIRLLRGNNIFNKSLYKNKINKILDKNSFIKNHEERVKLKKLLEKINLLSPYLTRTRKNQIRDDVPIRRVKTLQVDFNEKEYKFYSIIESYLRQKAKKMDREFHYFALMNMQRRAASCLSVISNDIKNGISFLDDIEDIEFEENFNKQFDKSLLSIKESLGDDLCNYDFSSNDSKFNKLMEFIEMEFTRNKKSKVLIFAQYKGTLEYLLHKIKNKKLSVDVIHGGIKTDDRQDIVYNFNSKSNPQILLASEVGSEGLDMHHNCNIIVNYDLPWNPMKVEQRIGRLDRVGQKSKTIQIVNFRISNTIEARVYSALHEKIFHFQNSIGDLASIIGEETKRLAKDFFIDDLSSEELEQKAKEARIRISNQHEMNKEIEGGGDLLAWSDYLQDQVKENIEAKRFIEPIELKKYVKDYFMNVVRGCVLNENTPIENCFTIGLSPSHRESFNSFLDKENNSNFNNLYKSEMLLCFDKDFYSELSPAQKRSITYTNHLSPLIRWITSCFMKSKGQFQNVSSFDLISEKFEEGFYLFKIYKADFLVNDVIKESRHLFCCLNVYSGKLVNGNDAEIIINTAINDADHLDKNEIIIEGISKSLETIDTNINQLILDSFANFKIKFLDREKKRLDRTVQRCKTKINIAERSIKTATINNKPTHLFEGRIKRQETLKNEVQEKYKYYEDNLLFEYSELSGGVIRIKNH